MLNYMRTKAGGILMLLLVMCSTLMAPMVMAAEVQTYASLDLSMIGKISQPEAVASTTIAITSYQSISAHPVPDRRNC